ncbi:MAG: uracil-DNA glycosylase family protein [Halobacteriaceae archaeon]
MDAEQRSRRNPFGMDEGCARCDELCATRERVLHGYGDVAADFLFVDGAPTAGAERTGVPLTGDERGERVQHLLGLLGLSNSLPSAAEPELENTYLTHVARCRHPERGPADAEVRNCEPYLSSEVRMINPEVIVPVGELALREVGVEYTTRPVADLDVADHHATSIRGRGFELVPMRDPASMTDAQFDAFLDHFEALMARDYRQTKGRRSR